MLRQLVIDKKLGLKKTELESLRTEVLELDGTKEALGTALEEARTDEDLETVESKITELEEKKSELEGKIADLEAEIAELEDEAEELNSKAPEPTEKKSKRGEDKMNKGKDLRELQESVIASYVRHRNFNHVRTGDDPDPEPAIEGMKLTDGGVLVPEQILALYETPDGLVDLSKYVNVVPVTRGSGSYPIITGSGGTMASVAELENNPELAKPEITKVDYSVSTYRGYVPISQELIDDADYPVTSLIAKEIKKQEINTKNAKIIAILKTATAKKNVVGIDDLKTLMNVDEIGRAHV